MNRELEQKSNLLFFCLLKQMGKGLTAAFHYFFEKNFNKGVQLIDYARVYGYYLNRNNYDLESSF